MELLHCRHCDSNLVNLIAVKIKHQDHTDRDIKLQNNFISMREPRAVKSYLRCFTCGKVLANKYRFYQVEIKKKKISKSLEVDKIVYLTEDNIDKTAEGEVLDFLGLNKYCCRRHMLTHVDIE